MSPKVLNIVGLFISLLGVITIALGLIVTRKRALKIGVSRIAEDDEHQNMSLPHVRDEIRESRFALLGISVLIIGFLFQIMACILST